MAKRINVKLIMELSAGGLTQNEIASSRHFSKTSVNLVLKTARELNIPFAKCTLFADQVHPFR